MGVPPVTPAHERKAIRTIADVELLVRRFYQAVIPDPLLGRILHDMGVDWGVHIPKLIDFFDKKDKRMFEVAEDALAEITKQRLGASAKKWRAWWTKNHDKSRIVWLIDGLNAKDPALRKSAAEELRAVTGLDMGYDDDAPKRQREESRQRWLDWWNQQNGGRASL